MPGRLHISILVGLVACTWAVVLVVAGSEIGWEFAKPFSLVVGFISGVLACFDRWLWRWPLVRVVAGRPDLEGTYWGRIRSEWVDPATGQEVVPISAALVIRQSYFNIIATVFTEESASTTIAAALDRASDDRFTLSVVYRNEPRLSLQDHSRIHHGGVRLQLAGPNIRLHGSYWTDRNTKGEMEFTHVSRNRATDFEEGKAIAGQGAKLRGRKR